MGLSRSIKPKKIEDERIQKILAENIAPMYSILLILTTISLIVKMALKLHPALYILEIIALILSPSYYILSTAQKNILGVKEKDEAITNIKNSAKSNSYSLHFWVLILGWLVLCVLYLVYPLYFQELGISVFLIVLSMIAYSFMGGIPLSIANKKSSKKGLFVAWNSKKSKITTLKRLKLWFTVQAICGGVLFVVICLLAIIFDYIPPEPFNSVFTSVVAIVLGTSVMYFPIKKNMVESEKYADKELEHAEKSAENQEEAEV
ncbi:DUF6773 family protein [Candidatus Bathycorpusculum sp.]|jgi:hypothetical protein|uniref:DUF6773 family protein n=1 Tax=Candidatus Bathycorpusculum sp. TaxID=2994959 RepID=UPI00281E6570|nr:hypothetical protein [Candidatus Termitimicrobium sp.]MCL2685112.1 hypothetical protein [Candidatus Termitimicrobium sp.]MDR2719684.1 hypothetical protein [Nitrososphaerota archaeon]